jgi:redox-sensing transcriptional repressor
VVASPTESAAARDGATPRSGRGQRSLPEATLARLTVYYRALQTLTDRGVASVSSDELAALAGVTSVKLRKDLSMLGSYGTRGVGYQVPALADQLGRSLGLTKDWAVVIVGVGNLGRALAHYAGFFARGFRVVALFDTDVEHHGDLVGDLVISPVSELGSRVGDAGATIGVIATPASSAQDVADQLVEVGITSILNFAPTVLSVPDGVDVRKVDLASELQILAYHEQRKSVAAASSTPTEVSA